MSQRRTPPRFPGWIATLCALGAVSATAATYKCKDADGNWSEAACQTKPAAPAAGTPAARAPAAASPAPGRGPFGPNGEFVPAVPRSHDTVEDCANSLENDSGFERSSALSICHSRPSETFYMCIFHLETFGIDREEALRTCLTTTSKDVLNCIFKGTRDINADKKAVISACLANSN